MISEIECYSRTSYPGDVGGLLHKPAEWGVVQQCLQDNVPHWHEWMSQGTALQTGLYGRRRAVFPAPKRRGRLDAGVW